MNKQRKTSHILNVFQYDVDGHVVLPASLTLSIAPAAGDNNSKVPTTAWVRTYVSGLSYQGAITLTVTGTSGAATLVGNTLNIPTYTLAGLGGQAALSGTGFVKISGTTISYDTSTYATETYVGTAISNLVDAAPGTLDTLNELAAALGDDPNFATTVSTSIGTKVPQARTLTINGTTYDLTANRSWTINSMVYPSTGIALSTGTAWGTSITDNSANWNTAFGWGNHASAGYLTSATAATTYVSLTGSYANPAWITSLAYSKITGVPAFLTSYTETDTLASVTGRGSSTSSAITLSGAVNIYNTDSNDFRLYYQGAGSGSARVYYHQPTNELRIYATSASPEATISIGSLKLYISSTYRAVLHEANYSSYALPLSGGAITGTVTITGGAAHPLAISSGQRYQLQVRNTNNSINSGYGWWWFMDTNFNMGFHADGASDRFTLTRDGNLSVSGTLSGSNLSGTNTGDQTNISGTAGSISGFNNPTTSATANTIVYRDSAGDIYGRYLFGSYQNSSDDVNTGTITYIMAKFGDNYHRSATAAKVQAFLGLGSAAYINASASASASTVVTRDSNAYIFAQYFNAPANSASPTTSAPTSMIGRASASDKYYYDFSAGAVQSFLGLGSMAYASTGSYLPLSGGTITTNGFIDFGPNSTWGSTLRVGGNGHGGTTRASVCTTNGNLHLDGGTTGGGGGIYLNAYHNGPIYATTSQHLVLHAGNYNSYSPTLTGGGASGTWAISISGIATTATTANNLAANTSPTIQVLNFTGVGTNSGNANQSYAIYQEGGEWSPPFPDLCIGYHTGIKLGAYYGYNGIRFFNNSDFATQTFSVNDGDNHVRVAYNLYVASDIVYNNMKFTGDQTYGFLGRNVYADTINGRGSDPLELNYYDGGSVIIGTGVNGSKALYAGSLFSAGSAVITTANIGSQTVSNAGSAGSLPTKYDGAVYANPQQYFNNGIGLRVAMTGAWSVWSDTLWINGYSGGDVLQMCALHTLRNGTPRMAISVQGSTSTSYGTFYEFITTYNMASQTAGNTNSISNALGNTHTWTGAQNNFLGNGNTASTNNVGLVVYSTGGNGAQMSFHRSGAFAVNMGLDSDNVFRIGGWSAAANRLQLDMSGNLTVVNVNATNYYMSGNTAKYITNFAGSHTAIYIGGSQNGYSGFTVDGGMRVMVHTSGVGAPCGFYHEGQGWSALFYVNGTSALFYAAAEKITTQSYGVYVTGEIRASSDITAYYSDIRLKKDIDVIPNAIEKIKKLRGVTYTWNEEEVNVVKNRSGQRDIGLIAQEVEAIEPLFTKEYQTPLEETPKDANAAANFTPRMSETYKTIKYDKLVALLVEGMKEQQLQIEELKNKLDNVLSSR